MSENRDLEILKHLNKVRDFQKNRVYKNWCLHYEQHLDALYNIMISRLESPKVKKILRGQTGGKLNLEITREDFYAWVYANTEKFYNPRKYIYERPLF